MKENLNENHVEDLIESENISENISESEAEAESEACDTAVKKNVDILSCFPIIKKHPYITLAFICAVFNFGITQESARLVASWMPAFIFGACAILTVSYLTKTTEDFVLSPRGIVCILPLFAFVALGGICFNKTENGIFAGSLVVFVSILALFLVLKFTGRLTLQNAVFLIFLTGFAVRIIYALYTPIASSSIRQHDVWRFIAGEGDGLLEKFDNRRHAEYIEYIAKNLSLPTVDPSGGLSQLYHPPFHHIIAGLWLRLNITFGMGYKAAVEGIQFLTVFYSASCMITGYKIFRETGLSGKKLLRATALLSLFPWFFLFAGGVNNDMLSVALGFGAILTTIKWYKDPKISRLLLVALTLGLGMFTKLSMGLLAPAIAYVFLMKFISVCKKRDNFIVTKKGEKQVGVIYMICGFALFAIVVFPLGLGWQVKNLILWDMPLTYVPSLSHTTNQYVGFHSVLERFFGVNAETIGNPFVIWGDDGVHSFWEYNMGLGALKTGLFGEDDFFALGGSSEIEEVVISAVGKFVCAFLYVFAWGLVILSVISLFMFFKKKCCGMSKISVRMLAIIFVTFLGNYVVFCFGYPFTCTMNFRYIVPCLLLPIVSLSACSGEALEKKGSALGQLYVKGVSVCTKGFCIFGALSYVLLALMPY